MWLVDVSEINSNPGLSEYPMFPKKTKKHKQTKYHAKKKNQVDTIDSKIRPTKIQ